MRRVFIAVALCLGFLLPSPVQAMDCDNRANQDKFHYGSRVQGEQVRVCAEWWIDAPKTKPAPNSKPVPKPAVDPFSFVVTPAKPKAIAISPLSIAVGQYVSLTTTATVHNRIGTLMGRRAVVRFIPTLVNWVFGDGARQRAASVDHLFASPGRYAAQAIVNYAVKIRFVATTRWLADPRGIQLATNRLVVTVSASAATGKKGRPLLVNFDCRNFQYLGC